jgi:hypothetical protein
MHQQADPLAQQVGICIAWSDINQAIVKRVDPNNEETILTSNSNGLSINDVFEPTMGQTYHYKVKSSTLEEMEEDGNCIWVEPLPTELTSLPRYSGQENAKVYYRNWTPNDWQDITVVPVKQTGDNQAVDSRPDTRYVIDADHITYRKKNFNFGNRIYRGGLFVGHADVRPDQNGQPGTNTGRDYSWTGRSFLKFNIPAAPSDQDRIWAVSMNTYCTDTYYNSNTIVDVGCEVLSDTSWDTNTLVWDSPANTTYNPNNTIEHIEIGQNKQTTAKNWCTWRNLFGNVITRMYQTPPGILSVRLASMHENNNAWAYFAKKEYDETLAPRILYAYGHRQGAQSEPIPPIFPIRVTLDSASVTGGDYVYGTVYLNGPAIAETGLQGTRIFIETSSSYAMTNPKWIIVPTGQMQANFLISTQIIRSGGSRNVTIKAYKGSWNVTANLMVNQEL